MHFRSPEIGYQMAAGMFKRGVLMAGTLTNSQTIRIEPPLVITYEQIDEVLNRLEDTLQEIRK
jgi:putrescine aminotransferase